MIESLNLPKADLKLSRKNNEVFVWCIVRKKKLLCTPEEWVRQHVIHYLINVKKYPVGLIASEYSLEYNGMTRRADVVVFNQTGNPSILVECKATSVPLTEKTVRQIAHYNFELDVDLMFLTNGNDHIVLRRSTADGGIVSIAELPTWAEVGD